MWEYRRGNEKKVWNNNGGTGRQRVQITAKVVCWEKGKGAVLRVDTNAEQQDQLGPKATGQQNKP